MNSSKKLISKYTLIIFICTLLLTIEYSIIWNIMNDEDCVRRSELVHISKTIKTSNLPHLYIITPTYKRPEQIPELVRLSQTLLLVPKLTWLVIEDGYEKNEIIENILEKFGLKHEYLLAPMPEKYRSEPSKPKGVSNRNKGLEWIRNNTKSGVVYFADDDNTYDIELFMEIRKTQTVSMFPVGLVTELGLSSPIVENCTFKGFYDGWIGNRKFPVDMAGFAVSVEFLLSRPNASMPYLAGYEEDGFLKSLSPFEPKDAQLLASCCSKILVWHTRTLKNEPAKTTQLFNNTNIELLLKIIL
ncbi:galactosylgalactosylxylosylprotein 3-beta-glucuronosyltransferase P-like [Diorhabda carinulata]|uniref:galactosylgalactosylxylosylprotein 3-beta-glucuronosyltransferase P-like n=1 Tax=Diorhabda carinulata TaxID=1163345 RepID=UPI0025A2BCE8|nr:galactosylgalactosylxylosylprotein 3-beta-glucuronosyltransferase P-like [Diorhabda carinulata]